MPYPGSCVDVDLTSHRIRTAETVLFKYCDSPILNSPWDAPDKGSGTSGGAAEDETCTGASPVWTGTSNLGEVFLQWNSKSFPELIVLEVALDSPKIRLADTISFVSCDSQYRPGMRQMEVAAHLEARLRIRAALARLQHVLAP
jgi:hypothetical protein